MELVGVVIKDCFENGIDTYSDSPKFLVITETSPTIPLPSAFEGSQTEIGFKIVFMFVKP